MGRRAKEGNHQLKPESFIICQDEKAFARVRSGDDGYAFLCCQEGGAHVESSTVSRALKAGRLVPSRMVMEEEPLCWFLAVKVALHELVSSSCTSGKKRSRKWYYRIFNAILSVSMVNSHVIYCRCTAAPHKPLKVFVQDVITALLEGFSRKESNKGRKSSSLGDLPQRLTERHFICQADGYPDCVVCSDRTRPKGRRQTKYLCRQCGVGLCVVPCNERSRPSGSSSITTLDGGVAKGYTQISPVEWAVGMQQCPNSTSRAKFVSPFPGLSSSGRFEDTAKPFQAPSTQLWNQVSVIQPTQTPLRAASLAPLWYNVLPFGLSLSSCVFTKVTEGPLVLMREYGVCILNYLDDWLILAQFRDQFCEHRNLMLSHLSELGFLVNWEKSKLSPVQRISFLGMELDSVKQDSTPHRGSYSVGAEQLEYIQRQDGSPTEIVSEAPGAYGCRSGSNAARFASYETASALASRPSPEMDVAMRNSGDNHNGMPANL
ncbi:hypothetical protein PO909_032457 [Leuciscus waleckii]